MKSLSKPLFLAIWMSIPCSILADDHAKKDAAKSVDEEKKKAKGEAATLPHGIVIVAEFIEVEHADFSSWLLENTITTDATPLRESVQSWVDDRDAKVIHTAVVHARSGQRAKVEAIHEWIYPTEYDPAEISSEGGDARKGENVIPPNPTAFETRNVGFTLEVDPVVGPEGDSIDLNLAPEVVLPDENTSFVTTLGDIDSVVEMPRFLISKVTTQVSVRPGDYSFLGTSRLGKTQLDKADDPILLFFVRCDLSGF